MSFNRIGAELSKFRSFLSEAGLDEPPEIVELQNKLADMETELIVRCVRAFDDWEHPPAEADRKNNTYALGCLDHNWQPVEIYNSSQEAWEAIGYDCIDNLNRASIHPTYSFGGYHWVRLERVHFYCPRCGENELLRKDFGWTNGKRKPYCKKCTAAYSKARGWR